jgi:hypothetical protein
MTPPTLTPPPSTSRVRFAASSPASRCQDVVRGFIRPVERPHLYRVTVSVEVAR